MRIPRVILVVALLVMTVTGCGDDGGDDGGEASPDPIAPVEEVSAAATPAGYVDAVNRLCDDLAADSTDVTGGAEPTREQFLTDQPKLAALIEAFDAEIAKLEVTGADRAAADALREFQRYSDAEYAKVVAAAEGGDDGEFDAAFGAFVEDFQESKIPARLADLGITCPAR